MEKEYARRREAIEDDDSDEEDMEVIEWNENTLPEDIMDGEDLEEYYRAARQYIHKDNSSTEKEQMQQLQELSKLCNINPHDFPGYKTFFQDKNSFDNGLSDDLQTKYSYYDSIIESHPELMKEFALWNQNLEEVSKLNVRTMSDTEFHRRTACPLSILSVVDDQHKHLFQLHKSDFIKISPSKPISQPVEAKKPTGREKTEEKPAPVNMTYLQSRIANAIGIVFESMWKVDVPVSVTYVSNSSKLHDIFVYLKFADEIDSERKETVSALLESKKPLLADLLQIILKIPVHLLFLCQCRKSQIWLFALQTIELFVPNTYRRL